MKLHWREADGYSNAFGKWFQRFNRDYVTKDKLKTFHSLRHTFTDTLKQAGVQEALIAALDGHKHDSLTMSRYGKAYKPQPLLEALLKVDY
jgi:integrase